MEETKLLSYRKIMKTTTLFGGVQVIQIITSIARGKIVAILLGANGMGINTLFNSVINIIVQFSGLGLNFSAVRNISQANENKESILLSRTITVFYRWTVVSTVLGAFIIVSCSFWFSKLTFGNNKYTWGFIWLSTVVILNILNNANIAVLQGVRALKNMAKASLIGSIVGLIFCLPLYYLYRENGIIPALIISSLITCLLSWYFAHKIKIHTPKISVKEMFEEGSDMAKLGIAMMVSTLIGSAVNYLTNAYIGNFGSIADVGFYGAGISITNQYVGVIFTAMAVDYFPRLSAVCSDKDKVNEIVDQQADIVLLIIAPLLMIMILTAPLLIQVLLSKQFVVITNFVCWVAFAMLFKAASFAVGYISFAKGDKKTFFLFEGVIGSLTILIFNIAGYITGGLTGIAISILLNYIIYFIAVNLLTYKLYNYRLSNKFILMFCTLMVLLCSVLIIALYYANLYGYIVGSVILSLTLYYSYSELNKRINLNAIITSKLKR